MVSPNTNRAPQPDPAEGALFPVTDIPEGQRPPTQEEVDAKAHAIGTAAVTRAVLPEEPDATDRWLEDRGGGTDRGYSLAIDPPRAAMPSKSKKRPYRGVVSDADSAQDPNWGQTTGQLSEEDAKRLHEGAKVVRPIGKDVERRGLISMGYTEVEADAIQAARETRRGRRA